MNKSILILGASALQVPLIKYVKARGYKVIVVSIPGKYPGFDIADKCVYCDVRDTAKILCEVRNENIVSVLTDETDIAVPTVAALAKKLGVSGNSIETARIYSNKFLMRSICREVGVCVPEFFHASTLTELKKGLQTITFPAIMKPEDNQGSRGIYKIYNANDAEKHFPDSVCFSKTGNVIVENLFVGKEFVVEGFVVDGEYINFGIAERKYFAIEDTFIPSMTIFPSLLSEKKKTVLLDAEKKLHKKLKPSFGMIHSEYLVNEDNGEYILVETALRGGGVYISSHLVPLYSSCDNYDILLRCSLGEKIALSDVSLNDKKASAYMCFYLPQGEVIEIKGIESVLKMPNVSQADLSDVYAGMKTQPMLNKTMRLGPIIIHGQNREELDSVVDVIKNTLHIYVRTEDGEVKDVIWE